MEMAKNYDYSKQVSDKQLVEPEIDIFDSSKKKKKRATHPLFTFTVSTLH